MNNLTPADLKAIQDEAQSMMNQIESGRPGDFEYFFGVYHHAEALLHAKINELFTNEEMYK